MFRSASNNNIEVYADSVTCFIRKCVEDVVPTKIIRIYPNQKPWINSEVCAALNSRTFAFNSGTVEEHKQASYALRKTIRVAKRHDELNTFYARFEGTYTLLAERALAAEATEVSTLSVSVADVTRSFRRVNIRKAAGPDGIPGRVIRECANQLASVFTDIFNLSLSLSVVPTCFKTSTIVPVTKQSNITCLNDWRPVALTPIISKCFERLVRDYICSVLPPSLDPLQFAYRNNRSTDDAIASTIYTALSHLEKRNTYVRMLFVNYSSAFNTIVPSMLDVKLRALGLNSLLCSWILDFLSNRRQVVRMGSNIPSSLTLNYGVPQGSVLGPLLFSIYMMPLGNIIRKHGISFHCYADDTQIYISSRPDENAKFSELTECVKDIKDWMMRNFLLLNPDKTEVIPIGSKNRPQNLAQYNFNIIGCPVTLSSTVKDLGVILDCNLSFENHISYVTKTAFFHLRNIERLRKFGMNRHILTRFYTSTVESIVTGYITAWYGNTIARDRKALQRVVHTASRIIGGELPSLQEIYARRCVKKARRIIRDSSHPSHGLFSLLPSGRRYRSIRTRTSRLHDSFFPQAIRFLNS
ncbi:hypothetical protein PO909_013718 [Leuciscus waleckii]